jgi:complement component 1 Q subcomponent-binding protein, mitochondrial
LFASLKPRRKLSLDLCYADRNSVKITFTIEDIKSVYEDDAFDEDLESESAEGQPAEGEAAEEDDAEPYSQPFTAKLNITVTKDGKPGAMVIEALAQNSEIEVSDLYYFRDAKLADPKTLEEARSRDAVYPGPAFANLDEELQSLVEQYVAEKGVNEAMATFVADYIDWKEQNEYVKWLEGELLTCRVISILTFFL